MYFTALIFGLLGSFHCMGMCGPIAFLLPVDRNNNFKKGLQIFLYHAGRIFSYTLIGAIFGLLGKSISLFGLQQKLSIIIGLVMLSLIFIPAGKKGLDRLMNPAFKGISKIKSQIGAELKKKRPDTFFSIGFLNGLLPCGLVYMAVLGATAVQGMLEGAAYMAIFGLGTIPLMTAVVWAGNFVSVKMRNNMKKAIPVMIAIMGVLFIIRGMGLGIPYMSPKQATKMKTSIECHPVSFASENNK
ncbi:hypothetical protein C7S20_03230 [Christiangramia fulva]|uniref:Urease accessory protein UreH-like transmembrane domain-containing protein n=1 Tax=Christiangramia fulva TaxID=2126553 RepID=A0A2R3Z272_9FLAO|nr:sulfite exporter TauE/SafE family protein [Christiangramia fulva]AVR44348.1 hypothetical protein C7S20_03230 [Christiangramia fulva]